MKIININSIKTYLVVIMTFVVISCADENLKPIVTFDDAGHGAYPRLKAETGVKLINILSQADYDASQYGYTISFIDDAQGGNVAQFILSVEYDAVNDANSQPAKVFATYPASAFTDLDGYKSLVVDIKGTDVTAAFGLVYADLTAGDNFKFTGALVMNNEITFTSSNSSATVKGSAFQGYFDFTIPAGCPSALEGTFDVTTTLWCDAGNTTTTTVDIVNNGGGSYSFSDWSFGAYKVCYGCCAASGTFSFTDVCTVVTLNDGDDSYGDSWTFTSRIVGTDQWEITWLNYTYANGRENGVSTITFPGGVPFTLAP